MSVPIVDPREEIFHEIAVRTGISISPNLQRIAIGSTMRASTAALAAPQRTPTEVKELESRSPGGLEILRRLKELGATNYTTGAYLNMLYQGKGGWEDVKKELEKLIRRGHVKASKDRTGRMRFWLNPNRKMLIESLEGGSVV